VGFCGGSELVSDLSEWGQGNWTWYRTNFMCLELLNLSACFDMADPS
jgi:hypothetical protein